MKKFRTARESLELEVFLETFTPKKVLELFDEIGHARTEATAEERRRCILASCEYCRTGKYQTSGGASDINPEPKWFAGGYIPNNGDFRPSWLHHSPDGYFRICEAHWIRCLEAIIG